MRWFLLRFSFEPLRGAGMKRNSFKVLTQLLLGISHHRVSSCYCFLVASLTMKWRSLSTFYSDLAYALLCSWNKFCWLIPFTYTSFQGCCYLLPSLCYSHVSSVLDTARWSLEDLLLLGWISHTARFVHASINSTVGLHHEYHRLSAYKLYAVMHLFVSLFLKASVHAWDVPLLPSYSTCYFLSCY